MALSEELYEMSKIRTNFISSGSLSVEATQAAASVSTYVVSDGLSRLKEHILEE